MNGIKNLKELLSKIEPSLREGEFVFCSINENNSRDLISKSLMFFREEEGITIVVKKEIADYERLKYECIWKLITLNVNSDLSAVGFLAKVTEILAKKGISVNAVSAYYHDHLFVPFGKEKEAVMLLKKLQSNNL